MIRNIIPQESGQKWKLILDLYEQKINNPLDIPRSASLASNDDPFDCQDLIVPVLSAAVDRILVDKIAKWEELDSRLVNNQNHPVGDHDSHANSNLIERNLLQHHYFSQHSSGPTVDHSLLAPSCDDFDVNPSVATDHLQGRGARQRKPKVQRQSHHMREQRDPQLDDDEDIFLKDTVENNDAGGDYAGLDWGWHANRIRLPDGFDYACRRTSPPAPFTHANLNPKRRQVFNIEDPLGPALDYESELWKIFQSTPVEEDIEKHIMEGCLCKKTLHVKREIEEGIRDYTRMDAHALGRMRKKERHAWPTGGGVRKPDPALTDFVPHNIHNNFGGVNIRVECWRRLLKRGSSIDADRLEIEFCGEQTLLDLHEAILTCANDQLFIKGMAMDHRRNIPGQEPNTVEIETSPKSCGLFFIENTFYTTGDTDYHTPIINWLERTSSSTGERIVDTTESAEQLVRQKTPKRSKRASRYEYLGLSSDQISTKFMKDTRLDSLSFRIGVRYAYFFHGDCEISIFFTDVRLRLNDELLQTRHYPLFHDIWTSSGPLDFCEGCEKAPATVVTMEDELTDGGPTFLCIGCHHRIHYTRDGSNLLYNNFRVFPLHVIQFQKDFRDKSSATNE
jgi:hypothetical protein